MKHKYYLIRALQIFCTCIALACFITIILVLKTDLIKVTDVPNTVGILVLVFVVMMFVVPTNINDQNNE